MALRKKVRAQKRARAQLQQQQNSSPPDNRLQFNNEQESETEQPVEQNRVLPVTSTVVEQAAQRLKKYRAGKKNLEKRIVANEDYWKLRQWDYIDRVPKDNLKINTAWLWNCISAKHADLMDGYPEVNIRPKREDDKDEARKLKAIIPVIYKENNYENTYSELADYLLKQGGTCAGVFWDGKKHDGLGEIVIKKVDLLNLFWEPGISNIQDSREVFNIEYVDNDRLKAQYPQLEHCLGGKGLTVSKYRTDDNIDYTEKSIVVDWYYKKVDEQGDQTLHYCKFVDSNVLFATENDPEAYPNGWYDHGEYPFIIVPLFPVEGSICGYAYTDIGRGDQNAIDIITSAIMTNAAAAASPRYFSRSNSGINESEFLDYTKPIVHVAGSMDEEALREISPHALPSYVTNIREALIDEMKESLGNRDVSNGGTTTGVTAASAIAAMQEQSGKLSRVHNRVMYNLHCQITNQVIELMRQFYTLTREYRITGEDGQEKYVQYVNEGLQPKLQPSILGIKMGLRLPCFDIEVSAAKQTPYNKLAQNELALQLYNAGVFSPQNVDQALALLRFMDFDQRDEVMQVVQSNGTMLMKYQQLQKVAFELAQSVDSDLAEKLAQAILMENGQNPVGESRADPGAIQEASAEPRIVSNARAQAQEATQI